MRVLVAEDDRLTRQALAEILDGEGHTVIEAADGAQALALFERERPDFVCLDIMMPGLDGYELCRRIRAHSEAVPIVFITAKSEEVDAVVGLELGADDYIVKPFGVREVLARIRAVARRARAARGPGPLPAKAPPAQFGVADLEVSPDELRARRGGQVIDLSRREVELLALFAANPGRVLDRDTILDACWGVDYVPSSRTLDQHISVLRRKIELDPRRPRIIRTVHGAGYRYE
jgi:DNA-binding response OmpR family regulator